MAKQKLSFFFKVFLIAVFTILFIWIGFFEKSSGAVTSTVNNIAQVIFENSQGTSFGPINSNQVITTINGTTGAVCGNNIREGTEQCDGIDLAGQTCQSRGFDGGTLSCYSAGTVNECTFDTSNCTTPPTCDESACGAWIAGACGDGTCQSWQRRQTRTCPSGSTCFLSRCIVDSSCGQPPSGGGIWLSPDEIMQLPMSGGAWSTIESKANSSIGIPDLSERRREQVIAMAKALYYVRTGDTTKAQEVRDAISQVMGTESRQDSLGTQRNLGAWAIAADLIDLKNFDPNLDNTFRAWIWDILNGNVTIGGGETLKGKTIRKPNNHGTAGHFSWAALAAYIGDRGELDEIARVFEGWLGNRSVYTFGGWGSESWQCYKYRPDIVDGPVGINPKNCLDQYGHDLSGILPDDQRRGCSYSGGSPWPPCNENYIWTGLQGTVPAALILHRAGYPAFEWEDQAVLRTHEILYNTMGYSATSDDAWVPWIVDCFYGTNFANTPAKGSGKTVDFTDWTHAPGNPWCK